MTPAGPSGLALDGVSAGYGTTFQLAGIGFAVAPGAVVGLLGPNGSGKSTLLRTLAGVLAMRTGEVTLGGRPLAQQRPRVAFVPQREEVNWDFPVTALGVVLMGRYRQAGWLRWPGAADRRRAGAALAALGLDGLGGRHISEFSGGQQQRIFLARAMVQDPLLVLLDEPFTGIDQANREVLQETVRRFAAGGTTVLLATHDLDEARSLCSHLLLLRGGRSMAFGPASETFTPASLKAAFGGAAAVFA